MNMSDFFSTLYCLLLGAPIAAIVTLWHLPDAYVARAVGLSLLVLALIAVCGLGRRCVDEDFLFCTFFAVRSTPGLRA
jgi:hypothetical protein